MLSELNEIVHVKSLLTVFLILSVLDSGYGFISFFPKCSFCLILFTFRLLWTISLSCFSWLIWFLLCSCVRYAKGGIDLPLAEVLMGNCRSLPCPMSHGHRTSGSGGLCGPQPQLGHTETRSLLTPWGKRGLWGRTEVEICIQDLLLAR